DRFFLIVGRALEQLFLLQANAPVGAAIVGVHLAHRLLLAGGGELLCEFGVESAKLVSERSHGAPGYLALACSTILVNAAGSLMARSARILRSISMCARLSPPTSLE